MEEDNKKKLWKMKIEYPGKKHTSRENSTGRDAPTATPATSTSSPQSGLLLQPKNKEADNDFGFPRIDTIDREHLATYFSVVQRSPDDLVTKDELKPLQAELEALLSLVVTRQRNIQAYLNSSNPDQDIVEKPVAAGNQRKRKLSDNRASTSTKDLAKARDTRPPSDKPHSPSSCDDTDFSGDPDLNFDESSKVAQPKINDLVNKFWSSVEPYVADITEDNIKELDELIKFCDHDMVDVAIPKLGRHYSEIWAHQDLNSERQASSQCHGSNTDSDSAPLLQQAFNHCKERTPGPMVQRLVSALLEDSSDRDQSRISDDVDPAVVLAKLPLFHTSACFERRIRRELQAIGLLDSNNSGKDEIYEEIKKCQEELKEVAAQNKRYLMDLMAEAKFEMSRQEIKRKIKAIDVEVIEMQRKTTAAKLKKKQLPPKIREQAWKILKDREALSNELLSLSRN